MIIDATIAHTENFAHTSELSDDALRRQAPAAFAGGPSPDRSPRYTYVPTDDVVSGLRSAGWVPVSATHVRTRTLARVGYQKHLIRLRRPWAEERDSEHSFELVLINAHDGTSAYHLHAGVFRRICLNGLVVADACFESLRFPHRGSTPDKVVEGSLRLVEALPRIQERIGQLKSRILTDVEQIGFAERAMALRYPKNPPVRPFRLLDPRRNEDVGNSAWTVFNRIQENLIRGGVSDGQRTAAGYTRVVRGVRGIASTVALNKGLWDLAEQTLAE